MKGFFNKDRYNFSTECEPFIWFSFFLVIILSLFPFFKIGFTSGDDLEFYMTSLDGRIFTDTYWYARGQGRFYQLITKPLAHITYLIDWFYFTKIIQYGLVLLSFILFAITTKKLFKLKEFSLLIFLLLFVFLSVTREYDFMPIIAYPFFFTCSFSVFLGSILLFLRYTEIPKNKYLIGSAVLYAIALLFYETYLILLMFITGFIFFRNYSKYGRKIFSKKTFYKEILPFIFVALAYLLIYFVYRKSVQTGGGFYSGSSFAKNFSWKNFFQIITNYNLIDLPTYIYHNSRSVVEANSLLVGGHQHNFWYILKNATLAGIINTLIQCFLFVYIFTKLRSNITWKKIMIGIVTTIFFSLAVHLLQAISEKYNTTGWHTHSGYVTSFFSYFLITLCISLIFYSIFKLCSKKKWLKVSVISIFTIIIFYISITIGYTNDHLSRDWELSQNRFKSIDRLTKKGLLDNIPDSSFIYAGDLFKSSSRFGYVLEYSFSLKKYVFLKTNKSYNIYNDLEEFRTNLQKDSSQNMYYIAQYDSPKSQDMLTVLMKINSTSLNWKEKEISFEETTANEAEVYYYSANKDFYLTFYIPDTTQIPIISINDKGAKVSNSKLNMIRIINNNKREETTTFKLKSNTPFRIKDFSISNIGFQNVEEFYIN